MKREFRRGTYKDNILLSPKSEDRASEFQRVITTLQNHLIHTRELLNGRDFLFSGSAREIQDALTYLVETEHTYSGGLKFDFTQVEEYFLLRIQGPLERKNDIESYFAPPTENHR